ncbi:MAG: iron-sulfur cluster assembly scaffold protein, partial [Chthoniobacteraceae bacterium]
MWVKFTTDDKGRKIIDRATFQTFGCETALAVASVATELIAGKTVDEALNMSGAELSAPLGALPPMKIHCAQLVEGALRQALAPDSTPAQTAAVAPTLIESFAAPGKKVNVVFKKPAN